MPDFLYVHHMYTGACGGQKGLSDPPGTGVTGTCELPDVGAGNPT